MSFMKTFMSLALAVAAGVCFAQEPPKPSSAVEKTNAGPAASADPAEISAAQQALRAYLRLQEQLQATQRALQEARTEAAGAARSNATVLAERLKLVDQNLAGRHLRDLEAMEGANRTALIVVGTMTMAALLLMVFTAWFQMQSMQKFADAVADLRVSRALEQGPPVRAIGEGESKALTIDPAQQASLQFVEAVQRLQKRVEELEHTAGSVSAFRGNDRVQPDSTDKASKASTPAAVVESAAPPPAREPAQAVVLLQKGQTLLSLDRAEEALACFEEALTSEPDNAELLLKKGTALERLERLDEAIASYDQAIAANKSLITAYLLKGGILSRMNRQPEALGCYEMALRNQHRSVSATA